MGRSSAWRSASSAKFGSRWVGRKGSAIRQDLPSFNATVTRLPTGTYMDQEAFVSDCAEPKF
jgi:hypothetical protein